MSFRDDVVQRSFLTQNFLVLLLILWCFWMKFEALWTLDVSLGDKKSDHLFQVSQVFHGCPQVRGVCESKAIPKHILKEVGGPERGERVNFQDMRQSCWQYSLEVRVDCGRYLQKKLGKLVMALVHVLVAGIWKQYRVNDQLVHSRTCFASQTAVTCNSWC